MKQILIITAVFPPEPVVSANLSHDLANELAKSKKVTVISPRPTRPFGFNFQDTLSNKNYNFKHEVLRSITSPKSNLLGRLLESLSFGLASYKYIKKNHNGISEIYANTWPLLGQFYAVKAARKFGIPITIHIQDIYPETLSNKLKFGGKILNFLLFPIENYVFKYSKNIVAISENMKEYLCDTRDVVNNKIISVTNWQDEEKFKPNVDKIVCEGQKITFMYLGNIGPLAGLPFIISSFAKANLKAKLIIAGSGSARATCIATANAYPNIDVEFRSVPEGKVDEIQQEADVFILPLIKGAGSTSIPSKLPAYMFSGRPILACVDQDSETAKCVLDANCGWIVEPNNEISLIDCFNTIVSTKPEILSKMGYNANLYAMNFFSKRQNLKKLISLFV